MISPPVNEMTDVGGDDLPIDHTSDWEARRCWFREQVLPLEPQLYVLARRAQSAGGLDPEDLVQDVLIKMMDQPGWTEIRQPLAFMARMMRNLAIDAIRRTKVVPMDALADLSWLDLQDDAPGQERILGSRDELAQLMAIVDGLPKQCRAAFLLRRVQGFSVAEVAERLGIAVSTAEKHLVRGLRLCTERLARDQEKGDGVGTGSRTIARTGGRVGRTALRWRGPS